MAGITFDIKDLFSIIWNYKALPFPFVFNPSSKVTHEITDYNIPKGNRKTKTDRGEDLYGKNLLGVEVFMPVKLKDPIAKTELQLENTLLDISLKKTIIETLLVNRQNCVKEIIAVEDWEINIKGIIVSADEQYYNSYPDREVKKLRDMVYVGNALEIINALTDLCFSQNEKVIITNFRLLDARGLENAQPFEIEMSSDIAFELIIE